MITTPHEARAIAEEESTVGPCDACHSRDPHVRTRHQLALARQQSLDYVRAHLAAEYPTRPDSVDATMHFLANLIEQYSHMVDVHTGAPLHWADARTQMVEQTEASAQQCYEKADPRFRAKVGPPGYVPGFSDVEWAWRAAETHAHNDRRPQSYDHEWQEPAFLDDWPEEARYPGQEEADEERVD